MSTYSRHILSGSTNGAPVTLTATATGGTTIHTAATGTTGSDEIWLWGVNTSTTDTEIVLEWGNTASTSQIPYTIPQRNGLHLLIPGLPLNNALAVSAFSSATSVISVVGYVNRITT